MQQAARKQSTSDRVREMLLRQILSGELAPGSRLREMEIARSLQTSQAPVREALRELEARELVVTETYKGTYVREITRHDMYEAYQVRATLEAMAGESAAARLNGRVEALRALAQEAERVWKNVEAYAHTDHALHRGIVEAAGNRLLLRSWDALAFESRIQMLLRDYPVDLQPSLSEHEAILDALEQQDGARAGELLSGHSLRFTRILA